HLVHRGPSIERVELDHALRLVAVAKAQLVAEQVAKAAAGPCLVAGWRHGTFGVRLDRLTGEVAIELGELAGSTLGLQDETTLNVGRCRVRCSVASGADVLGDRGEVALDGAA